jgi:hypothetical protein
VLRVVRPAGVKAPARRVVAQSADQLRAEPAAGEAVFSAEAPHRAADAAARSAHRGVPRPVRAMESGEAGRDQAQPEAEAGEDRKESGPGAARQTESVAPEAAPVFQVLPRAVGALIPELCWRAVRPGHLNLVPRLEVRSRESQVDVVAQPSVAEAAWVAVAGQADGPTCRILSAVAKAMRAHHRGVAPRAVTPDCASQPAAESGCHGQVVVAAAESREDDCPLLPSL